MNEKLWCLGAGVSEMGNRPDPRPWALFKGLRFFAKPLSITWRVWDVSEHRILMGGESHGVYTRGPRPKFHFLTLPSRFPSRPGSSKRGRRSAVGSLRGQGGSAPSLPAVHQAHACRPPTAVVPAVWPSRTPGASTAGCWGEIGRLRRESL